MPTLIVVVVDILVVVVVLNRFVVVVVLVVGCCYSCHYCCCCCCCRRLYFCYLWCKEATSVTEERGIRIHVFKIISYLKWQITHVMNHRNVAVFSLFKLYTSLAFIVAFWRTFFVAFFLHNSAYARPSPLYAVEGGIVSAVFCTNAKLS